MSKSKYDHILVFKGPSQRLFEGRAVLPSGEKADLLLLRGVPEPVSNTSPEFAEGLVEAGVCLWCDAEGHVKGKPNETHPSVLERKKLDREKTEAEPTAPDTAEHPVPGAIVGEAANAVLVPDSEPGDTPEATNQEG